MIVIYHFEAKNSKKIFGPNATSGECTTFSKNAFRCMLEIGTNMHIYMHIKESEIHIDYQE